MFLFTNYKYVYTVVTLLGYMVSQRNHDVPFIFTSRFNITTEIRNSVQPRRVAVAERTQIM